jgi:hypothetical protein
VKTIVFFALLLFISSCDSTSSNSSYAVSGTITIEGVDDLSFAVAALYREVAIDEELKNYKSLYPNIGASLSQADFFDHRRENAVKTVNANAGGNYKISDVSSGTYNLVISAPGYGWVYETSIDIGADQSELNYTLYPETEITNGNSGSIVFEENHFYKIKQNINFFVPKNIDKSCTFLIENFSSLNFYNTVIISPASGRVKFYFQSAIQDDFWNGINILAEGSEMRNLLIERAAAAINIENLESGPNLDNCFIVNSNIGISAFNVGSFELNKSTFHQMILQGVALQQSSPTISRCIFNSQGNESNGTGIEQKNFCETMISKSIFIKIIMASTILEMQVLH